jgi:hypothetical protein
MSRAVVPYDRAAKKNPQPQYGEEELAGFLRAGKSFVLQGPPLDGKSHTLYEVVRRMEGYELLRPKREKVPDDDHFSLLFGERRIIVLLDDITQYVDSDMDLYEFARRLGQYASSWVVASTCRDGPELGTVKEASPTVVADLGQGVLDTVMVETAAYVLEKAR